VLDSKTKAHHRVRGAPCSGYLNYCIKYHKNQAKSHGFLKVAFHVSLRTKHSGVCQSPRRARDCFVPKKRLLAMTPKNFKKSLGELYNFTINGSDTPRARPSSTGNLKDPMMSVPQKMSLRYRKNRSERFSTALLSLRGSVSLRPRNPPGVTYQGFLFTLQRTQGSSE